MDFAIIVRLEYLHTCRVAISFSTGIISKGSPYIAALLYSASVLHKPCQFLRVALGFTVHAAAVGLTVYAHFLGKIYASLPVRSEIPVEKGRSTIFLSQSFTCSTYGLVGLVAGVEQA